MRKYSVHVNLIDGTEFDALVPEPDWDGFCSFLEATNAVKSYSSYYREV